MQCGAGGLAFVPALLSDLSGDGPEGRRKHDQLGPINDLQVDGCLDPPKQLLVAPEPSD